MLLDNVNKPIVERKRSFNRRTRNGREGLVLTKQWMRSDEMILLMVGDEEEYQLTNDDEVENDNDEVNKCKRNMKNEGQKELC